MVPRTEKVKALASYDLIEYKLKMFNDEFGNRQVSDIKLLDLENYQIKRSKQNQAPATVDLDIHKVRAMVYKAYDNDLIGGGAVKAFKRVKDLRKKGEDVRDRVISPEEFNALV